jgi:hypothetical protein
VTIHQVNYEGPPAFAVQVAHMLADAPGVELKSAREPEPLDGPVAGVLLALTVQGTTEDVTSAVIAIREALPADARITMEESASPL